MRRWITIFTCVSIAVFMNSCGDDGHNDIHAGHDMDAMSDSPTDSHNIDVGGDAPMDMGAMDMGIDVQMDGGMMDGMPDGMKH